MLTHEVSDFLHVTYIANTLFTVLFQAVLEALLSKKIDFVFLALI